MSGSVQGPRTGGIDRTAGIQNADDEGAPAPAAAEATTQSVDTLLGLRPRSSGFGGSLLADQLLKGVPKEASPRSGPAPTIDKLGGQRGVSAFVGGARPKDDGSLIDLMQRRWEKEFEGDREMLPPPRLRWDTHPEADKIKFESPIQLSDSWNEPPLDAAMDAKGRIDLNKVTPEMLSELNPTDLKTFMRVIGEAKDDRFTTFELPFPTNTDYPNAASALAAKMLKLGDAKLAARLFAAAPDAILPYATGKTLRMLVDERFGEVLGEITKSKNKEVDLRVDPEELAALGSLVKTYLGREVGDDPAKAAEAVQKILADVAKSGVPMTPETMGVLMGSLIGGLQKHFDALKMSAEERKSFMNKVFDGAEKVLGKIPGPWGTVLPLVTKGLKALYNSMTNPSDNEQLRLNLTVMLERQLLENKPEGWSRDDVQDALQHLETALNANGIEA